MGDKENEEIWKILQKEIRIKSEGQEEDKLNEHSSEPIGTEKNDTDKEGISIFIDELEKRRQMANSGSIVLSGNGDNPSDGGENGDDNGNEDNGDNNDDGKETPPFDPRDCQKDRQSPWSGGDQNRGVSGGTEESFTEFGKENNVMKKSIRIMRTEDSIKVRFFVGEEEFGGMSVNKGSSNSINFGGTTIYLDGDETVLEM